jgi:2-polyprenyl-6-methoxyphenol hydroxylase-like FAD-dependent oxidoreductase
MKKRQYDVAIVGASIAGTTAAMFFARQGLQVALIERKPAPDAYKPLCTHLILSCAVPTIQRLGLADAIERAGAIRNGAEFWTRYGWIRPQYQPQDARPYGYNIRRQKLDPILRDAAIRTRGVDYFPSPAQSLIQERGRFAGVNVQTCTGAAHEVRARLVVGADGRYSQIARLANLECTQARNDRFAVFAYFRDVPLATGKLSQVWFLEPDAAYAFPNDDGLTLLGFMPHKDRLAEYRSAPEESFYARFRSFPNGPDANPAKRVSSFFQMLDFPNISRRAAGPGLALIGDAAMASDPVWGVGCAWAFQSAEWLVEQTAEALKDRDPDCVDAALQRYRKVHRSMLGAHHSLICDFSKRRKFNLLEKIFFAASVDDPETARHFDSFGNRRISVGAFLHPGAVLRAARVALRRKLKSGLESDGVQSRCGD